MNLPLIPAAVYHPFRPHRPLREYRGHAGFEPTGQLLTTAALDALAESVTSGLPCELVVIGEFVHEDGTRYLDFAVPKDYIEAVTNFRHVAGDLHVRCPECDKLDGKHYPSCDRK